MMSPRPSSRRSFLQSAVGGSMLMPAILGELLAEDAARSGANPLAARAPHFLPKAKQVIFLYMSGGVSQCETFDPKPRLVAGHGKEVTFERRFHKGGGPDGWKKTYLLGPQLVGPQGVFQRYGQSGTEVSGLFPHVGKRVDDLAVIRSMHGDHANHYPAALGIHTGSVQQARPSIGAWVSYGLGTVNRNLPSFIAIAPETPYAGGQLWGSDFLPGSHQGTHVVPKEGIRNISPRIPRPQQQRELAALAELNRAHLDRSDSDDALATRIRSFETAFAMQAAAPEAFDLSRETDETLALYGLPRGSTQGYAWQCLVARRLVERGVRFVELIDSGASLSRNWDSHGNMSTHIPRAKDVDQPIAALLTDLKRRSLLDDTLVVWTTEFGRLTFGPNPGQAGRDHSNHAFSSWLAGAGVKAGTVYGSSDEYGIDVAEDGVHVHDFHATILHLLGLDHTKLTYRHAGRDFRLTDVHGRVVKEVLA